MKKIRVLHITEPFAAGVYNYVKEICGFFDSEKEFESYVIYSPNRNGTDFDKIAKDFSKKTKLIQLPMSREINFRSDIRAIISLVKQIRKIQPDVIHLHSSKASILGRVASAFYKKAKVYYTPNGYSFLREDVSNGKKGLFLFIEKWVVKIFGGTTIACGDTEYEHAKKIGRAFLVRNGVSPNEISEFKKPHTNGKFTIGTMGRLSPQKNPALFNQVAQEFPDIEFVWIGDGQLKTELTSSNVSITGWKIHSEAMELVNTFDVYIQTSLWEGLPFTIIEAMALEKPVVATNVVGNKDAVEHGHNGFLCDNLEDFTSGIGELYKNPEKLSKMGRNSETRCRALFDQHKNFTTLKKIYLT
ncbi:glycosyltransferase [Flagellimonas flava]|uniref:glycosyltransferase n=1 Tax=Flagellimonas flava TaxID=570519 RepID=UPI003D64D2D1